MVLFKNPRDQQQIAVLARQMYPHNSDRMLQIYNEATQRPYGYLLIDLKPETPEEERLKTNVLKVHKARAIPTINVIEETPKHIELATNSTSEEMYSCNACGQLFQTQDHLIKHKDWSPIQNANMSDEEDVFTDLIHEAMDENHSQWNELFDKYKEQYGDDKASKKATKELLQEDTEEFMEKYSQTIKSFIEYNQSPLHRKIMNRIKEFTQLGIPLDGAVDVAVKENEDNIINIVKLQERYNDSQEGSSSETESDS
jgi:hypothetical protein